MIFAVQHCLAWFCASRCTNAIPSTRIRWGFAAVERGKHHLPCGILPFLLCSSFLQSHLTIQYFSCTEFSCVFFQYVFLYASYPDISKEVKYLIFQVFWTVASGGCWDWVLRCHSEKRLSCLNGELCLITVVISLSMTRQPLSLEASQCPIS